jgi:GntR family transcriptional regulator
VQLLINPSGEVPIYRQIMRQIIEAIAGGRLTSGAQLPSHRDLSEQLVIAPLTVKKAYDELEALGYIESQRGRGTFVCDKLPPANQKAQASLINASARALLAQAYLAGFDLSDVLKILKEADRGLTEGPATRRQAKGRAP